MAIRKHNQLVAIFDYAPDLYGTRLLQYSAMYPMKELRPYLRELYLTQRATVVDIVDAMRAAGYSNIDEDYVQKVISKENSLNLDKEWKERTSTKSRKPKPRMLKKSDIDIYIVEVCRSLPLEKVDSRVFVRYLELTGALDSGGVATFLTCCDVINFMEERVADKAQIGKIELEDIKSLVENMPEITQFVQLEDRTVRTRKSRPQGTEIGDYWAEPGLEDVADDGDTSMVLAEDMELDGLVA